jgi:superfamily II DNA or RNA helicase
MSDNIKTDEELINESYEYPDQTDPNIQYKLYKKREFYYNKIPKRPDISDYNDIKEYRKTICDRGTLHEHQAMLSNFITPDTPFKGLLVFHGLGTGKTCVGIAIAEKFKLQVKKYGTKIIVLVPSTLLKENWKNSLLTCTGETYMKFEDQNIIIDPTEKEKIKKQAITNAMQYYRFMSYRSFYKHVLGDKIVDRKISDSGTKKVLYRKTIEGEFERDISIDRIYNLNNTLLIVDEAHNLTGNAYGEALVHIIKNSVNLRVLLLTGTPMKNLADDVIELINFIRPLNSPILRDKIFNSEKGHLMEIKEGGEEYLRNMIRGYISHVRGSDPLLFATRVDKGIVPNGLEFTKLIRCNMEFFQKSMYNKAIQATSDALDRKSEDVANFVFPIMSNDNKKLIGTFGREGLNNLKNQIKTKIDLLNSNIADFFKEKNTNDYVNVNSDGKSITGKILKIQYLKYFSIKFYKAIKKLNRLIWGKKGVQTAFVYSNLVKVGIELFKEILLQNGYLEFQENYSNYQINKDTICYFCGKKYESHGTFKGGEKYEDPENSEDLNDNEEQENHEELKEKHGSKDHKETTKSQKEYIDEPKKEPVKNIELKVSDTSSDYKEYKRPKDPVNPPKHKFYPATFITLTGKSSEESTEILAEDKKKILDNIFSSIENKNGKLIKLVLGSRIMNEGVNLFNIGEVHILDAYYNLGRVDQVVGRGIRWCSHKAVMSVENQFPFVNVYKYAVKGFDDKLSSEEELYRKAEVKYKLIKKVERIMKEEAIDCPLNMSGNMFKEEIEKYKNCQNDTKNPCPAVCDYTRCDYICSDKLLNNEFYDPTRNIYKSIPSKKLDYSTYTHGLARNEIDNAKEEIKKMYISNYIYTINDILKYVKENLDMEKQNLFDDFFVFKALDELLPITENDFNNFKDTIIDKYNRIGYLIYRDKYYIFQPFDQKEDIPMYYRTKNSQHVLQQISLYSYLKNNSKYIQIKSNEQKLHENDDKSFYNFKDTMEYYDNRDEFKYVGVIDKELTQSKTGYSDDIFKIREKRAKILEKRRGTGIPSLKGAVCFNAKSKEYLESVAKTVGVKLNKSMKRINLCNEIKEKMLELEKYSSGKNKITYVMIPLDHPVYPFPYNLEDRSDYIKEKITNEIKGKIDVNIDTNKDKTTYYVKIKDNIKIKDYEDFIKKLGAKKNKNEWIITLN